MRASDWIIGAAIVGILICFALLARAASAQTLAAFDGCLLAQYPDTQHYPAASPVPPAMTDLVLEREPAFVFHPGDVVEQPNFVGRWETWFREMHRLDGLVGWGVVNGNHDGNQTQSPIPYDTYLSYFGGAEYAAIEQPHGVSYLGSWGTPYATSSAWTFQCGSKEVLAIALGYQFEVPGANTNAISGASFVAGQHLGKPVIVWTHSYVGGFCIGHTTAGQFAWNNLLDTRPNVFLILNGHVAIMCLRPEFRVDGSAALVSLFNTQSIGEGDGWIQWLTIEWGIGSDPSVPSGWLSTKPYTVLRNKTAEEDGKPWWWTQTQEFGSVPVPEPSVTVSYISGVVTLLWLAKGRL